MSETRPVPSSGKALRSAVRIAARTLSFILIVLFLLPVVIFVYKAFSEAFMFVFNNTVIITLRKIAGWLTD